MKRILSMILCLAMLVSALALVSCGEKAVKLGVGVVYSAEATDATADAAGKGSAEITVAAVLVDEEGKIVKCVIDSAAIDVSWNAKGEAAAAGDLKTKYEKGNGYGMGAYGTDLDGDGVHKEWFEQIDAFCATVAGKTIDEVKALVAKTGYGVEGGALVNADCTMNVAGYIKALEKAVANAKTAGANDTAELGLGIVTTQDNVNATADKAGSIELETTIVATATDANGKVVAAESDAVQVAFGFNNAGVKTAPTLKSKREAGADYGMVAWGGATLEWFEQADAFESVCIGKTADEIKNLIAADYKGTEDVKAAGCTIYVSGLVSAAVKAAG